MADWRQIQARIRKAKNASDAHAKLTELYQRTRDAMVAWELGVIEEKAGQNEEAVKWYKTAVERFRRKDWKNKAEEALTRLGAEIPATSQESGAEPSAAERAESLEVRATPGREEEELILPLALGEIPANESEAAPGESQSPSATPSADDVHKKRRRGRRGGRGRHRKGGAETSRLPSQAFAESSDAASAHHGATAPPAPFQRPAVPERSRPLPFERPAAAHAPQETHRHAPVEAPPPMLPSERTAHGRAGDPALASRMVHLDSMLRRLISSPLHRLDESDEAPAGPGVFLLSDSDQITSYYVEACQTLRVGLGNLGRGNRASSTKNARGGGRTYFDSGLKAKLAEHLGIPESKVAQYLKDHCVVRWIQLDDDAKNLAHFAIGVLRTPLNTD
ncbi:MAG: hypothetical protein ACRD52_08440 [Candidatus Acidiferrales bacterium]